MKKINVTRLLSALLIFIFVFSLVCCDNRKNELSYDPNRHLEIIKGDITYSDAFIENANIRFTNLIVLITEAYLDINLKDNQKQSISEIFNKTVLPILYRIRIYEDELERLLSSAEENITKAEVISPFALYESALYSIGSRRSGILFFEISLMIIKDKEATARERYEQHGSERYLEDVKRYKSLAASLAEMGEEKFINTFSAAAFITSTAFSLNTKTEENAFLLEDTELLFLLDRQAKIFKEASPTDAECQTIGALINELIPINATGLGYATLYALKTDGYFNSLTRIMPCALSLYASVAEALKNHASFSLEGEKAENRKAIICALLESQDDIRALDTALTKYAKTNSERLKTAVTVNADGEALEAFLNAYEPIECDTLISEITKAYEDESADIESLIISYIAGFSPYISFVLFN